METHVNIVQTYYNDFNSLFFNIIVFYTICTQNTMSICEQWI